MKLDRDLLARFETELDPKNVEGSAVPAKLLGYGEMSAIFQLGDDNTLAYKRMPLFRERSSAEKYEAQYNEYCDLLAEAGLTLPQSTTCIVEVAGHPVVLYIAQQQFPAERIAHKLLHALDTEAFQRLAERIISEIHKVWEFNRSRGPALELAIDGQISNWALPEQDPESPIYYIDTSTPLYRKDGKEQLNPKLLLQAAPGYLRWLVEWLFLDDVMNRYYDARKVFIDVAANLYKEQRPDLIPSTVEKINRHLSKTIKPLTIKDIDRYYREDKIIWSLFLTLRRIDRWVKTRLLHKRYEFILPGKIER